MKQRVISFLYRDNVRSAMQVGVYLLIGFSLLTLCRLFIIFYWAAFYPA